MLSIEVKHELGEIIKFQYGTERPQCGKIIRVEVSMTIETPIYIRYFVQPTEITRIIPVWVPEAFILED